MPAINTLKAMGSIDNDNYPEGLRKLYALSNVPTLTLVSHYCSYFVNTPSLFTAIWKMLKGWYDPVTISKISIHSSVPKEIMKLIIPEDELPISFGGTSTLPLPDLPSVKSLKAKVPSHCGKMW